MVMSEDNRENIELEIDDETFLYVAKRAHEQDITFNMMIEQILRLVIEEESKLKELRDSQE